MKLKRQLHYIILTTAILFCKIDLRAQWVEKNNGLFGGRIHAFAVNGDNIYAGTEGGVFLSSNNGATWTAINNGLTNQRIRGIVIIDTKLFVGTYGGGVFRSIDNGANWIAVNTGLGLGGSPAINTLIVFYLPVVMVRACLPQPIMAIVGPPSISLFQMLIISTPLQSAVTTFL